MDPLGATCSSLASTACSSSSSLGSWRGQAPVADQYAEHAKTTLRLRRVSDENIALRHKVDQVARMNEEQNQAWLRANGELSDNIQQLIMENQVIGKQRDALNRQVIELVGMVNELRGEVRAIKKCQACSYCWLM
mmetsp:Transcript_32992/g.76723  ORF Transcript_32992/g.76723 Transcript_32992/m.76723 type:complete len:135 (+) Transcript_32992:56-460(+)|eukprot:CAMPEP_0171091340 /NCGR_PEP_ID=MMETSP0766_2-20121228/32747_1 /TAXON_ID=439317 /ORGANISM="Gambierdiscus australes, Strain CAWD 149" /LENGTH=134 /DNA_ID=CAMNT_0011549433 /DNA_START=56 /DNA_END=460 /DNA_ORIENTATION=-